MAEESTGGEGANALVCKTSIRRFNSGPVLQCHFSLKVNPIKSGNWGRIARGLALPVRHVSLSRFRPGKRSGIGAAMVL